MEAAAWMTLVPFGTSSGRPSMVKRTWPGLAGGGAGRVDAGCTLHARAPAGPAGGGPPPRRRPRVAVALARRRQDPLVDELEVVHQGFDVGVDVRLRGERDPLVVHDHRPARQPGHGLLDDAQALADLLQAHEVAVVAVADGA